MLDRIGLRSLWKGNRPLAIFLSLLCSCYLGCDGSTESSPPGSTNYADMSGDSRTSADLDDLRRPTGTHLIRRLSNHELQLSLFTLSGMTPAGLSLLPPDSKGFTFDRVVASQTMSRSHFDAFLAIASEIAIELLSSKNLDRIGRSAQRTCCRHPRHAN